MNALVHTSLPINKKNYKLLRAGHCSAAEWHGATHTTLQGVSDTEDHCTHTS